VSSAAAVALATAVAAQNPSPPGYALALTRARQQAVCVTNFGVVAPTNEITIEFWQKVTAEANQCVFLLDSGLPRNCIGVYGPSRVGAVHWYFGDWQGEGSLHYWPPKSLVNSWQHFAFVASRQGGYMKIFRNGLEEASKPGMTPFVRSNAPLMIGSNPRPDGRWGGLLDEFRVWNVARSQAEIQADLGRELAGTESNLVAYWRFNESAGPVATDATVHGHSGALVNGPTWVASCVPPVPGAALSLNDAGRTNQYLTVPAGVWFDREFTIEAWVYQRSYQFSSCLLDFGNGSAGDNLVAFLSFEITGLPVLAGYNGEFSTNIQRSSVWSRKKIPLHTWTHVAFTRETNGVGRIYLDGAPVAMGALYAPRAVQRTNNFIGRSNWPYRAGPDAIIDDVRLWNVARSAEDIRREMECALTGAESNLVAYWRFDEGAGDTSADASGHGHTARLVNRLQWVAASAPLGQSPVAHTLGFSGLATHSVTLHGAVCPNGFPTTAWFEWGPDSRFGRTTVPVWCSNHTAGLTLSNVLNRLAPSSTYHFRIVCTNVMGRGNGAEFVVRTPPVMFLGLTLARWRFAGVVSAVVALLAGATVRHYYVRSFRKKLERLREQQALEQERGRIARDLHDDLGAAVTQLKLLGELVERDATQPGQTARHGQQISQTSRELARHMDELVWVVNPQKDHLENLVSYLAAYSEEVLGVSNIRCRLDFPDDLSDAPLTGHLRHRLFLAFKEAVHNVVKHAEATEVHVRLRVTTAELVLSVEDNGKGFTVQSPNSEVRNGTGGNGLPNMQARLAEVGGTCQVESQPGAGTKVEMRVKLA
jgi:signal transduction histidine kinase